MEQTPTDSENEHSSPSTADVARIEPQPKGSIVEVATLFLWLGFTAFGGPAAHIALIEDQIVNRRQWLSRQHFLDIVGSLNFIPGPNSTELAIHLGLIRAGWRGLVVAGVCFIVPAVLIILPLAWAYCEFGISPAGSSPTAVTQMFVNVNAVVVVLILVVTIRFAKSMARSVFLAVVATAAAAATVSGAHYGIPQIELIVLAIAAVAGMLRAALARRLPNRRIITLPSLLLTAPLDADFARGMTAMALYFLKVGATLFGSGYVLVTYLQSGVVEGHHWLTSQQLIDAISVGQVTPGPLLTTATFAGYVIGAVTFGGGPIGGVIGGIVATVAIFLPSFVLVALFAPVLQKLRTTPLARAALDAMNAAVVGLLAAVLLKLAPHAVQSPTAVVFAAVTLLCLLVWNINATWVIAIAAIGGLVGIGT